MSEPRLPGFEDEPESPPLATIEAGIEDARSVVADAEEEHGPIVQRFLLISGGNDSMALYDLCKEWVDGIVHINTGIGVPETNQFVRDVVAADGRELIELHPPRSYEDLILDPKLFGGFPGPGAHGFIYARLKERAIRQLLAKHRSKKGDRFLLLTGVRQAESQRRMGYANPINRIGGQVWVNPLSRWSNDLMQEYRETRQLPVNEVTSHLHMSGECLCGAFAHPGELEEIRFFYPNTAQFIDSLAEKVKAAGLPACKWGERPPLPGTPAPGPLCASCAGWNQGVLAI